MNTLTNTAIVVIAERNASKYIGQCLDSILSQDYPDLGIILVDDASDDNTLKIVSSKLKGVDNAVVVANIERKPKIENWKFAIRQKCSNPDSVIFIVDGDDCLVTPDAISSMMGCHQQYDVVWSQHTLENNKGFCAALGQWRIRRGEWISSHLMSFKKHLFDKIDDYYFTDVDGQPLAAAIDQATMFTVMEIAGREKCFFLDKVLYKYRLGNPISWHNNSATLARQKRCSDVVRSKIPFNLNEGLSVIVASSNNMDTIECVLESFYFQMPPPVEVLIVDKKSTDGMREFIKSIPIEKYPFGLRFYDVKNNFDFLTDEIEAKRILFTNADHVYPSGSFNLHLSLADLKIGRGMIRDLKADLPEYNPITNLQKLAGDSTYEVIPSNFSIGTELFCKAIKGCKELLSEDFIKKAVSLGAIHELLPRSIAYRMKPKTLKILPPTGPLGHLM